MYGRTVYRCSLSLGNAPVRHWLDRRCNVADSWIERGERWRTRLFHADPRRNHNRDFCSVEDEAALAVLHGRCWQGRSRRSGIVYQSSRCSSASTAERIAYPFLMSISSTLFEGPLDINLLDHSYTRSVVLCARPRRRAQGGSNPSLTLREGATRPLALHSELPGLGYAGRGVRILLQLVARSVGRGGRHRGRVGGPALERLVGRQDRLEARPCDLDVGD